MALTELEVGDSLRIIKDSDDSTIAEFFVISDNIVEDTLIESDISVQIPVFGNPYVVIENPEGGLYTTLSINIEGESAAFEAVKNQCAMASVFQTVKLVIGGNLIDKIEYVKGVITSISRKRNVTKGDSWVEGSLSFITIP